jgi:hypothetical protein
MAMGELLDRAASFWRSHFKAIFQLNLGFQVAQYVTLKGYVFAMAAWFPLMQGGQKMAAAAKDDPAEMFRQMALAAVAMLGTLPVYALITWFAGVAVTRYTLPALLGQPHSLSDALARLRSRALASTAGFFLSLAWLAGVSLLVTLPGAGLMGLAIYLGTKGSVAASAALAIIGALAVGAGLVAAMLWYLLRFFLTAQVFAAEDLGVVAALRRSGELVSGRIGLGLANLVKMRATILISVMAIILTAVGLISGLPALVIQFAYGKPLDPANASPDAVPQALLIPAELLQVLAQSAVGPLFIIFGVLFYVDMRVRREGLDLEVKLDALPRGPS